MVFRLSNIKLEKNEYFLVVFALRRNTHGPFSDVRVLVVGYFRCNFGAEPNPDDCGILQLENRVEDNLDWMVHSGQTPSLNTGPTVGHTTGRVQDMYLYIEASLGRDLDEAV